MTDNGGSAASHHRTERRDVSRGSIPTRHVRITVSERHGFYCNIYILISSTRGAQEAFYLASDAKQRASAPRNIYLAIRTCNNSGYSAARADRCTASSVRLCSLPPCLISTGIFYANDAPPSSLLHEFLR